MRNHTMGRRGITRATLVVGVMLGPSVAVQASRIEIFSVGANNTSRSFDNSGDVGVKDLLVLLGAWGPCP